MNIQQSSTPIRSPPGDDSTQGGAQSNTLPTPHGGSGFIASKSPKLTIDTSDRELWPVPSTPDAKASGGDTKAGYRTPSSGMKSYAAALSSARRKPANASNSLSGISVSRDTPGFGSKANPPCLTPTKMTPNFEGGGPPCEASSRTRFGSTDASAAPSNDTPPSGIKDKTKETNTPSKTPPDDGFGTTDAPAAPSGGMPPSGGEDGAKETNSPSETPNDRLGSNDAPAAHSGGTSPGGDEDSAKKSKIPSETPDDGSTDDPATPSGGTTPRGDQENVKEADTPGETPNVDLSSPEDPTRNESQKEKASKSGPTRAPTTPRGLSSPPPGFGNKDETTTAIQAITTPTFHGYTSRNAYHMAQGEQRGSSRAPSVPFSVSSSKDTAIGAPSNADVIQQYPEGGNLANQHIEDPSTSMTSKQGSEGATITLPVKIPDKDIGMVIGRFGYVIREIQGRTGTHISIQTDRTKGQPHRIATVKGPQEGCFQAQQMIERIIKERTAVSVMSAASPASNYITSGGLGSEQSTPPNVSVAAEYSDNPEGQRGSTNAPKTPYKVSSLRGYYGDGDVSAPNSARQSNMTPSEAKVLTPQASDKEVKLAEQFIEDEATNQGAIVSLQVLIPDKDVGICIGKSGYVVREMQTRTGTHIQIAKQLAPGKSHRIATVMGPQEGCQQVKQMIERIIQEQSSQSITAKSNNANRQEDEQPYGKSTQPEDRGSGHNFNFREAPAYKPSLDAPSGGRKVAGTSTKHSGDSTPRAGPKAGHAVYHTSSGITFQFREEARNTSSFTGPGGHGKSRAPEKNPTDTLTPTSGSGIKIKAQTKVAPAFQGRETGGDVPPSPRSPFFASSGSYDSPFVANLGFSGHGNPGAASGKNSADSPFWAPNRKYGTENNAIGRAPAFGGERAIRANTATPFCGGLPALARPVSSLHGTATGAYAPAQPNNGDGVFPPSAPYPSISEGLTYNDTASYSGFGFQWPACPAPTSHQDPITGAQSVGNYYTHAPAPPMSYGSVAPAWGGYGNTVGNSLFRQGNSLMTSLPPPTFGVSGIAFSDPEGFFRGSKTLFALGIGETAPSKGETMDFSDPISDLLDGILQEIKDDRAEANAVGNGFNAKAKDVDDGKEPLFSPKSQRESQEHSPVAKHGSDHTGVGCSRGGICNDAKLGKAGSLLESLSIAASKATDLLKVIPEDESLSSFTAQPTKQQQHDNPTVENATAQAQNAKTVANPTQQATMTSM